MGIAIATIIGITIIVTGTATTTTASATIAVTTTIAIEEESTTEAWRTPAIAITGPASGAFVYSDRGCALLGES